MLFMGSKKYPDEAEYMKFVNEHAGSTNAWTSETDTNYYFQIGNNFIRDGLDRFAQFFIEPLFDAKAMEREMKAVNSEFEHGLNDDTTRLWRLLKLSASEGHPFRKFTCGNLKTLNQPNIRTKAIKFYEEHYSANLMKLVIYGKEKCEVL